jgi:hypothetical protein
MELACEMFVVGDRERDRLQGRKRERRREESWGVRKE